MAVLESVSTIKDMKILVAELQRLRIKFYYDFYAVLQDFSSKKILPQWLRGKNINEVITKEYGYEVLGRIIAAKRHCIVVYDLETPDLNGLEFLANIEKDPDAKSKCKVIISTPSLPVESQEKLLNFGAKALISKPLVESELRAAFGKVGLDY